MANAKKCDRCGEFYILEISYYPDKSKEKYDLCKKCTNMLKNFLKEKKENTIYEK